MAEQTWKTQIRCCIWWESFDFEWNDISTLVGHFVSFSGNREKKDIITRRGSDSENTGWSWLAVKVLWNRPPPPPPPQWFTLLTVLPASVAQLDAPSDWRPGGRGFNPLPRSATFFRGDWSWNIFYGHSLPSADSRRAVVSFWRKNVHNTG